MANDPSNPTPPGQQAANSDFAHLVQEESVEHYFDLKYLAPPRMASFGYQVRLLCQNFPPKSDVLEIGAGPGLVTSLLRQLGMTVKTLDVDDRLNPTITASITEIPLADNVVDCFLCCQVLEHLAWDVVPAALAELRRVSGGGVLSVPSNRPTYVLIRHNHRSRSGHRRIELGSRSGKPVKGTRDGHYWELDSNVTTPSFRKLLVDAGFTIEQELRPFENLYHHFFVVHKR